MLWKHLSHNGGFLATQQLPENLPFELFDHERVQRSLFDLSKTQSIRREIKSLPQVQLRFSPSDDSSLDHSKYLVVKLFLEEEQEAAFSLFAVLASAFVHNQGTTSENKIDPIILPSSISDPLRQLSTKLHRLPIWDYAGCVLSNWKLIDKNKPISLENVQILRSFTGLTCEKWFYKIHVVIEAYGGQALAEIVKCREIMKKSMDEIETCKRSITSLNAFCDRCEEVRDSLEVIAAAIQLMKLTFSRMSDHCKDRDFFVTLRGWMTGWPKQGVKYSSNENENPVVLGGASGAQSSILPALDAFFGVSYMNKLKPVSNSNAENINERLANVDMNKDNELEAFVQNLKRFRLHMPKDHVKFLEELEADTSIRNLFSLCNEVVKSYFPKKGDPQMDAYIPSPNASPPVSSSGENSSERDEVSLPMFLKERERMEVGKLLGCLQDMKVSYNYAIESMLSFRRMHVGYATMYITRQAKKMAEKENLDQAKKIKEKATKGTGGSSFAKHFMSHISDTRKCLFKLEGRPRNDHEVDIEAIKEQMEQGQDGISYKYKRFEGLREDVDRVRAMRDIADFERSSQDDSDSLPAFGN